MLATLEQLPVRIFALLPLGRTGELRPNAWLFLFKDGKKAMPSGFP